MIDQPLENELIYRIARPLSPFVVAMRHHTRSVWPANGLERPKGTVKRGKLRSRWLGQVARRMRRAIAARPRRPQRDPASEHGDLVVTKLAGRGHLQPSEVDRLDDETFRRLARYNRRSRFAPVQDRLERIEPQATFLFLVTMARVAVFRQKGPDALLEEVLAGSLGVGVGFASTSAHRQLSHSRPQVRLPRCYSAATTAVDAPSLAGALAVRVG